MNVVCGGDGKGCLIGCEKGDMWLSAQVEMGVGEVKWMVWWEGWRLWREAPVHAGRELRTGDWELRELVRE